MPTPHLTTYRGRSRAYGRRRPDRRLIAAVIAAVILVVASAAIAFAVFHQATAKRPKPAEKPAPAAAKAATATPPAKSAPAATAPSPKPSGAAASRPATISVAAVGDMLFDRQVKALIRSSGGRAPLAHVAERLSAADVTVGNLETPLATSGVRNPVKEPKYAFRGDPAAIDGLKAAGFDAVSLANNHALDYGPEALAETIASLDKAGIGHAGAGADAGATRTPATVTLADGTRVAYLAFTQIVPPGYGATGTHAGVSAARATATVTDAVKAAKKDHDYVLVSLHWGVEYESTATAGQVALAHKAVDAGADMVLAHHPHVIQGVEFYKNRLIAYSLGDFVFDHYSRETGESFILDARLGPDGVTDAVATPVYLDAHGAPEYVQGKHAETILTRLQRISRRLGATVEIDGPKARLLP